MTRRKGPWPDRWNSLAERLDFDIIPEPNSGCWLWLGAVDQDGYGHVWWRGRLRMAHRESYERYRGLIPEGLQTDHLCRVTSCVNPWHMEPVTGRENNLRSDNPAAINARKTHCIRGHRLAGRNLFIRTTGRRLCRTCHREGMARRRAEARAA